VVRIVQELPGQVWEHKGPRLAVWSNLVLDRKAFEIGVTPDERRAFCSIRNEAESALEKVMAVVPPDVLDGRRLPRLRQR
jgi:hypothetical protein